MNSILSRCLSWLLISALLAGCANLAELRQFSGETSRLTSYTVLIDETDHALRAAQPFLELPEARQAASQSLNALDAARPDLGRLHLVCSSYFAAMARLSGDDSFSVDRNIDQVADAIKAQPAWRVEDDTVDNARKLARILADVAGQAYQQRSIDRYLREAGPMADRLLAAMQLAAESLKGATLQSQQSVEAWFEGAQIQLSAPSTPATSRILAKVLLDTQARKLVQHQARLAQFDAMIKALDEIRGANQRLISANTQLSAQELNDTLKRVRGDLKAVRELIKTF
ncbi:hypothetical protein ABWL39_07715 [Chitinivorax sp. PXF-14]|uniref:hypothetical protein n=1 Tax=Chitinivorax sp. PXF-14 TaxID=3230488 RepID=UPI003467545E